MVAFAEKSALPASQAFCRVLSNRHKKSLLPFWHNQHPSNIQPNINSDHHDNLQKLLKISPCWWLSEQPPRQRGRNNHYPALTQRLFHPEQHTALASVPISYQNRHELDHVDLDCTKHLRQWLERGACCRARWEILLAGGSGSCAHQEQESEEHPSLHLAEYRHGLVVCKSGGAVILLLW